MGSRLAEVMSDLESIGAVGETVVLLRPAFPAVRVVPLPDVDPPPAPEQAQARAPEPALPPAPAREDGYEDRARVVMTHEVCEEALQKLALIAEQVQDLQQVFTRLSEATYDAAIHQEARP